MKVREGGHGQDSEGCSRGGAAQQDRLQRGRALVCWDPLIAAMSGIVLVASAWNVMFDALEIMIASVG